MYGFWWGDICFDDFDWMVGIKGFELMDVFLVGLLWEGFKDWYVDWILFEVKEVGEVFIGNYVWYIEKFDGFCIVVYGDYCLDNMLFGLEVGGFFLVVVDW